MDNIRIIRTDVDVSKILEQLEKYPEDWGGQKGISGTKQLSEDDYVVEADVLQLVMGGIEKEGQYVGDTEICIPTPAYNRHTEILKYLSKDFKDIRRCGFLLLPPGGQVGRHIDFGTYYLNKDRYHLSLQGRYHYTVGDEEMIVEPGTLFWFNNKLEHSAKNIGDINRISFVFDVPHGKSNV